MTRPGRFPRIWPAGARHLHVGSFCAVDHVHGASAVEAMASARTFATTSFDPNIRPMVTPDREAVTPIVEREVALASFVKASEEDLAWLYPDRDPEATIAAWAQARPALLRDDARRARRRRLSPERAVRRALAGGRGRRHGRRRRQFHVGADRRDGRRRRAWRGARAPTGADLRKWLAFSVAASAITCTRRGADPPTRAEVLAWLAKA